MHIKDALPWLVPLLLSMLVGGYQLYSVVDRVVVLEENSRTTGVRAIEQLQEVDSRVKRLEEFCCGEVTGFKIYIEEKIHGMDVNSTNK